MPAILAFDLLGKRALITRESARAIQAALMQAWGQEEVWLDFAGIEAVTPSFVDEILRAVGEAVERTKPDPVHLVFLNPPTRLSSKFAALARARHLMIEERSDGAWVISSGIAQRAG